MGRRRRMLAVAMVATYVVLGGGFAAARAGIRINVSESVPRGVYLITGDAPARGDYVAVCPPTSGAIQMALERGYVPPGGCASGSRELLKVLVATGGDHVAVTAAGVVVNGALWPRSTRLEADVSGRRLPDLKGLDRVLSNAEVFVMSQWCSTGFDGRYFGALPVESVVGAARPLVLW